MYFLIFVIVLLNLIIQNVKMNKLGCAKISGESLKQTISTSLKFRSSMEFRNRNLMSEKKLYNFEFIQQVHF